MKNRFTFDDKLIAITFLVLVIFGVVGVGINFLPNKNDVPTSIMQEKDINAEDIQFWLPLTDKAKKAIYEMNGKTVIAEQRDLQWIIDRMGYKLDIVDGKPTQVYKLVK